MNYFTIWDWLIIAFTLLVILIIFFKPGPPMYTVHFINIKTGFTTYGAPVLEKAADIYLKKQKIKYANSEVHFWKEKVDNHSATYIYKRKDEMHIFGRNGVLQTIPEDLLPLIGFKNNTGQ